MKILSIGNSFSRNAHTFLNEIAASADCDLTLLNAYIGGCTFERHMIHADTYDSGCYLIGCVWIETLFGKDVRKVTFKPDSLSKEDAVVLRGIAHRTAAGIAE